MKTTLERFEEKHVPDPNSGCWLWIAGIYNISKTSKDKFQSNYGGFRYKGKPTRAHRVSWMLHKGEIGNNHVLHKCDNPSCVNPEHLFLGSHLDNLRDMVEKGRNTALKCDSHPNSKISNEQVIEMRRLRNKGYTLNILEKLFPIKKAMISRICANKAWNL